MLTVKGDKFVIRVKSGKYHDCDGIGSRFKYKYNLKMYSFEEKILADHTDSSGDISDEESMNDSDSHSSVISEQNPIELDEDENQMTSELTLRAETTLHLNEESHPFLPEASQDPENYVDFNEEDATRILEQLSYGYKCK